MPIPKAVKIGGMVIGGLFFLLLVSAIGLFAWFQHTLQSMDQPKEVFELDEERLAQLRSDPIYKVAYPNATELRRVERGSRGFEGGVEDPPTIMYFAGTTDADEKIIKFFTDAAISNGWYVFRGPGKLSTDVKTEVILHKDDRDIGSLFIRLYGPKQLNSLFLGEKLPVNGYTTIFQVTLESELIEPPWVR